MAAPLISLEEAASLLNLTPQQLSDLQSRREIAGVRVGSAWKFKMDELERYADERGVTLGAVGSKPSGGGELDDSSLDFESLAPDLEDDANTGAASSILVSEVELGVSENPSSTIIGDDEGAGGADSDLVLASEGDESVHPGASDLRLDVPPADSGELRLAPESGVSLTGGQAHAQAKAPADAKDLSLGSEDDLAMAGGSDIEPTDSDLEKLGGSDLELAGDSDLDLGAEVLAGAGESDLLLAGASDITSGDTGRLDVKSRSSDLEFATDNLDVEVSDSGSALDLASDEELVLDGESALDGDIALAGDSGINLAKPSDSGIDLANADESGISVASPGESGFMLEDEDAMQLEGGSSTDALQLPEEIDIVALDDELADPDAATHLKSDEDFDLTPVEGAVEDESDSGSQVIALDTEALDADAPTQLGGIAGGAAPLGLEAGEAIITEEPLEGGFVAAPVGQQPVAMAAPSQQAQFPVHEMPEAPYSVWQVSSLAVVALTLVFTGILMVDVMRNIWSFNEPYSASTSIMNSLLQALGINS